jgi:ABC-type Mn2+/Zn2+ transport system ATPase subunit
MDRDRPTDTHFGHGEVAGQYKGRSAKQRPCLSVAATPCRAFSTSPSLARQPRRVIPPAKRYCDAVPTKPDRRQRLGDRTVPSRGPTLKLRQVSKNYGPRIVLSEVTLTLDPASVCLLLGDNGQGKSTMLRLAAGLARPTTGTVIRQGAALYLTSGAGSRSVHTVLQVVQSASRLAGSSAGCSNSILDRVDLGRLAGVRSGSLSAGERARLTLAVALASSPSLLCLDEPTANLDPSGHQLTCEIVRELSGRGTAVLVATHHPESLGAVADARLRVACGTIKALP